MFSHIETAFWKGFKMEQFLEGSDNVKKNTRSLIIIGGALLSLVLVVGGIFMIIANTSSSGELLDMATATRRVYDENADKFAYIPPTSTALAGELSGSAESQAAAKAAFDLINAQRNSSGLGALKWSNGLEDASAVRAVEASQLWSHDRPNGQGEYWTVNSSIVYGENLAKGYNTAADAFQAWMNSPVHKDNIMFPDFRTAGLAIHIVGGQWYWANEFGY